MMREEILIASCYSRSTMSGNEDGIQNLLTKKMSSTSLEKKGNKDNDSVEEESE